VDPVPVPNTSKARTKRQANGTGERALWVPTGEPANGIPRVKQQLRKVGVLARGRRRRKRLQQPPAIALRLSPKLHHDVCSHAR
jgi:hypothetical protein